jgi:outer membrane protein
MKNSKRYGSALLAVCVLAAPAAMAQGVVPLELPDDINMVGLGVASVPDYYGSTKNEGAVGPVLRYMFGGHRYVQLLGPEATLNLVDRKDWRAGPLIRVRGKRDDDVDDEVVKQMRKVSTATEIGGFVAYHMQLDPNRPLHKVVFSADMATNTTGVYTGVTSNVKANYFYPFSQSWSGGRLVLGNIGFGMFFTSDSFSRRYFGVTGSDVALFPGLGGAEYRAEGGLTSIKIPFSVSMQLDKQWMLTVGGRYERLLGDAKDSPLVDERGDENQWGVGIGLSYLF